MRLPSCFKEMLVIMGMFVMLLLIGCDHRPDDTAAWPARGQQRPLASESIRASMKAVAQYQGAAIGNPKPDWKQSAYYMGAVAAYRATGASLYLRQATEWAVANEWKPGSRERLADDQAASQVYLALYQIEQEPRRLAPTKQRFERLAGKSVRGRETWDWCDALFMAPPVYAQLYKIIGQSRYVTQMDTMYWDSVNYLYEEEAQLFYRDERYFGSGVFWARGNGWAIASIVRILQQAPGAIRRAKYHRLLRQMAAALSAQQQDDGLWRSDLRRPGRYPAPETSGTAFFIYALAWGMNEDILSEKKYSPVVRRGWQGLSASVFPSGRLGWVQPPGSKPASASADDTFAYGSGAFLLAGSEVLRWVK